MSQRWSIKVELTWDIDPNDEKARFPGDSERDFACRGFERVRPVLDKAIRREGFAHYHIIEEPKRVEDG